MSGPGTKDIQQQFFPYAIKSESAISFFQVPVAKNYGCLESNFLRENSPPILSVERIFMSCLAFPRFTISFLMLADFFAKVQSPLNWF
jgi:hypothetical protein